MTVCPEAEEVPPAGGAVVEEVCAVPGPEVDVWVEPALELWVVFDAALPAPLATPGNPAGR